MLSTTLAGCQKTCRVYVVNSRNENVSLLFNEADPSEVIPAHSRKLLEREYSVTPRVHIQVLGPGKVVLEDCVMREDDVNSRVVDNVFVLELPQLRSQIGDGVQ